MDLSKLPKMSQTPPLPPSEPPQPGDTQRPVPDYQPVTLDAGVGGAVWISIAIGVILMLFGRSFAAYLWAKARGTPHNTGVNWTAGPKAGQVVDYWELQGYTGWTDAGIFIFGLAMVLEGIMLAALNSYISTAKKKAAVMSALLLGLLATLLNLFVAFKLLGLNIMPLMSALAVAFGVYMVMYEWKLLRILKGKPVGMS